MNEWLQEGNTLPESVGMELLRLHSDLNDMIISACGVHVHCVMAPLPPKTEWVRWCERWRRCETAIKKGKKALADASAHLSSAPLTADLSGLRLWCDSMAVFGTLAKDNLLERLLEKMNAEASEAARLTPHWKDTINDQAFNIGSAAVLLVGSSNMAKLPRHVTELHKTLTVVSACGFKLGLPPVNECESTRFSVDVAQKAIDFGQKTVNVAACVKLIGDLKRSETVSEAVATNAKTKLEKYGHRLPATLVTALEEVKRGKIPSVISADPQPRKRGRPL
jgi:hypothetical protein